MVLSSSSLPMRAVEPLQCSGHDLGIDAPAIIVDQGVAHLIDQPHGVERSGLHGLCSESLSAPRRSFMRRANSRLAAEVGEDYVAAEGKKCLVEFITIASFTGNVKFHWYPSKTLYYGQLVCSMRNFRPGRYLNCLKTGLRDAHNPSAGWEMKKTSSPSTVLKPSCNSIRVVACHGAGQVGIAKSYAFYLFPA